MAEYKPPFHFKDKMKNKQGQVTIGNAPMFILIIGMVFLVMATIALVGEKYQDSMTENSTAWNVSGDLQTEIGNNTSLAGLVLTIGLVGLVLTILMGVFYSVGRGSGGRI